MAGKGIRGALSQVDRPEDRSRFRVAALRPAFPGPITPNRAPIRFSARSRCHANVNRGARRKGESHRESHAEASNIIEIFAWSLHERAAGAEKHAEPAAHRLLHEGQPAAQRT